MPVEYNATVATGRKMLVDVSAHDFFVTAHDAQADDVLIINNDDTVFLHSPRTTPGETWKRRRNSLDSPRDTPPNTAYKRVRRHHDDDDRDDDGGMLLYHDDMLGDDLPDLPTISMPPLSASAEFRMLAGSHALRNQEYDAEAVGSAVYPTPNTNLRVLQDRRTDSHDIDSYIGDPHLPVHQPEDEANDEPATPRFSEPNPSPEEIRQRVEELRKLMADPVGRMAAVQVVLPAQLVHQPVAAPASTGAFATATATATATAQQIRPSPSLATSTATTATSSSSTPTDTPSD